MNKCDIIIPIFNAYDYVNICIKSIIRNTDLKENNLILINDKSTDERIENLIKNFKKSNSELNITVINNEKNLGFVGTVNKGMKLSKNDVLLLNSDTEVPKNWLNKIKECAYSGHNIATVTPLSNNATLVSIPKGLEKNDLPKGMTIDEYDKIVEKCSYCDYPELPTAHGFCMYIKREALDLVGYFDEEAFGKGYGEENDFSYRCLDYGYRNLLCDNTVVYHKESQSFNNEREKVIKEHSKILENRYPTYVNRLNEWCKNFPIKYICDNIAYYLNINVKQNILILIHDWETQVGGTTLHALDIINGLIDKYNFHVLAPSKNCYKLTSYFGEEKYEKYFPIPQNFSNLHFFNSDYKKMIEEIISSLNIAYVHIHHMIGHYFDIGDVIKKANIKATITLHDSYALCPNVNMLYKGEVYCDFEKKYDCKECLNYLKISNNNVVNAWHENWNNFLQIFDNVIVPSKNTKNRMEKIFDINAKVIEHGIDIAKSKYIPNIDNKKTYNIAFVGVMCNHKGAKKLHELIKINNKNYKIHLFGKSELPEFKKNKRNYIYHGRYNRNDLPKLLLEEQIDLICIFSTSPETYSYTLNEAILSNIPILTFNLGAGADRTRDSELGWIIDVNSPGNMVDKKIFEILSNKVDYNKKLKNILSFQIKSIDEMNKEYDEIYCNEKMEKDILIKDFIKNHISINGNGYNEELDRILNSTKWKLINKINFSEKFVITVRKIIRKRNDRK